MPALALKTDEPPPRPRGRPKTEDLAALEARLLSVSRELFFRNGYGATTMSEVARAARMSKTTLYSRFPSKADLFRAIVAAQAERWRTGMYRNRVEHSETLEQTLLAYGDMALRAGMTDEGVQLNRLMYTESWRFPELAEVANARFRRGIETIAERFRAFAEIDNMPCRDPAAAAELFHFMIMGWFSKTILVNQVVHADERQAWLEQAVKIFLSGRPLW